ncbi:hypothetical protein AVEN_275563-1 [Araneus ventricosus]|uniref:Transposase Tc1-like domain-containing protein n=1 Tax=Araneus ventricosus TaxID=182803 RepID=A0A4Y2KRX2_ARAVE|nr:hypothetical protein AVEN_275563-1 [Araneus ventricosus]
MEMGLSQVDAARRLNVSRSVVQRLWDQYQSEDSVSRRHVSGSFTTCRRPFSSSFGPKEKKHYCAAARCRPLVASGRSISAPTVRRRLHKAGLYSRRPVCVCPPQQTTEKGTLKLGKRTRFLDQTAMGFCTLHRRVQIHTGERFRASADLEGTTFQLPSIQHS